MQLTRQDVERLAREGIQALQQGRAGDARKRFENAAGTGHGGAQIWLLLAIACRAQQDAVAEEAALDQMLKLEPQAVRGLIMKADCRLRAGDEKIAERLYKQALRIGTMQALPEADHVELRRAQAAVQQLDERTAAQLEALLSSRGLTVETRSPRFQRSLDIMAGRKQVFFQEPTGYYFPELPQIQFYDASRFDWVRDIEAAVDEVTTELASVLQSGPEGFRPYIQSEPHQPRHHPLLDNVDWSALFLAENGTVFEDVIARCPRTWEAVQAAPLPWIERSSPTVMFSLLRRGTRIPAHTGMLNTRLICHLPLIVPPGCGFRVGNETREWQVGKLLIFDDTIEHEAWNESDEDRVVLIFDIWRPELSEAERREVTLLSAISHHQRDQGGA